MSEARNACGRVAVLVKNIVTVRVDTAMIASNGKITNYLRHKM